jgi:hypothetical protein
MAKSLSQEKKPDMGMKVHACNNHYSRNRGRKIMSLRPAWAVSETQRQNKSKKTGSRNRALANVVPWVQSLVV